MCNQLKNLNFLKKYIFEFFSIKKVSFFYIKQSKFKNGLEKVKINFFKTWNKYLFVNKLTVIRIIVNICYLFIFLFKFLFYSLKRFMQIITLTLM